MMATTIINSMSVKPFWSLSFACSLETVTKVDGEA